MDNIENKDLNNQISKQVKIQRNGGVEILRILCMFSFICMHIIGYSSLAPFGGFARNSFLLHLRGVLNVGVDIFAFISGFYGIKFYPKKAFNLLYIGIFSSLIVFFLELYFFNVEFKIISPVQIFFNNWFFREYLILFLLVSFINPFFDNIDSKKIKQIIFPLVAFYLWLFFAENFKSSFGQTPSLGNHHAMLLLCIYIFGRLIKKTSIFNKISIWILLLVSIVCLVIMFVVPRLKEFSSPFCILAAFSLFELFRRMSVPKILSKIACFISPSMLGILILHNAGSHNISGGLVHRYFDQYKGNLNGFSVLKYAFLVYVLALCVDLIRRLLKFLCVRILSIRKRI